MNKDILAGKWDQAKGKVKQQWSKLTDDDIKKIEGHKDELSGKLQERYGYSKDEAIKEIDKFTKNLH